MVEPRLNSLVLSPDWVVVIILMSNTFLPSVGRGEQLRGEEDNVKVCKL